MSRKYLVPLALLAALACAALLPDSPWRVALRALLLVPFALLGPGAAIVAALRLPGWGVAERLALALGLSTAAGALGGLALSLTPWGMRPLPWLALLGLVTLGAAGSALRGGARPPARQRAPGGLAPAQGLLLGGAALITVAALGVAVAGAQRAPFDGFTELWAVPTAAQGGEAVHLGVGNRESGTARYRLTLTADGRELGSWPALELAPGAGWEATIALPADLPVDVPVEATLYRLDDPTAIYRRVQIARGVREAR